VVDDGSVGNRSIGKDNRSAIRRFENGIEDLDGRYFSGFSRKSDGIAHPIGFEKQNQYTPGEVAQRSLKGQTNRQAGSSENRQNGRSGNAQHSCNGDEKHHLQRYPNDGIEKRFEGKVQLPALKRLRNDPPKFSNEPPSKDKDKERPNQFGSPNGEFIQIEIERFFHNSG
jgi:hypothetical protein